MVVPRSAKQIAEDAEFVLYAVVVLKQAVQEFTAKARDKRWTVRALASAAPLRLRARPGVRAKTRVRVRFRVRARARVRARVKVRARFRVRVGVSSPCAADRTRG